MKCKRDSDGRQIDHTALQAMRIQAVRALERGHAVAEVAAAYGVDERSVYRWLAAYAEGGQQALEAKPIPGRPAKLKDKHLRWLAGALRGTSPQQCRFDCALSTLKALLTAALERLIAMPQRVAGFFRHPHCRYILDALGSA